MSQRPLIIKHIKLDNLLFTFARTIFKYSSTMKEALGEHNTYSIYQFFKTIGIDTKIKNKLTCNQRKNKFNNHN